MNDKKIYGGLHVAMKIDTEDRTLLLIQLMSEKLDNVDSNVTRSAELNTESHAELFKEVNGLKLTVEKNAHHSHKHCDDCAAQAQNLVNLEVSVKENFKIRDTNINERFAVRDRTAKIILAIIIASGVMSHLFL